MNKYLHYFIIVLILSCGKNNKQNQDGVYFAGEIVNPTSDYVVLYKNDVVIDSSMLDDENHFVFRLDNLDEGLHHFDHSPELQYVYLEPGDSLALRLNTMAFDESLVFSGTNGDVNNFLVEMFLNYEDEERFVYSLYTLEPQTFSEKIDSLRQQKMGELTELRQSSDITDNAYSMAKAAIDYSSFSYKEKYPFYHKKYTGKETIQVLDSTSFYDYRKNIDVSNEDLVYFRPYYNFMKLYFGNVSYKSCLKKCGANIDNPKNYLHLNKHKMALIDSSIKQEELRNNLFRSVAMDVLLKEHSINEECKDFLKSFETLSTNSAHHQEVRQIYESIGNLQPNKEIPDVNLISFNNQTKKLKHITGRGKAVIYFWSGSQKRHFRNIVKHINYLQGQQENVRFIGVCLNTSKSQWQNLVKEASLDPENQYWSDDFDGIRNKLILDGLNKCIVTKDSLIDNGFAYLSL